MSVQCAVCQRELQSIDPYLINNARSKCVCMGCLISGKYQQIVKDQLILIDNRKIILPVAPVVITTLPPAMLAKPTIVPQTQPIVPVYKPIRPPILNQSHHVPILSTSYFTQLSTSDLEGYNNYTKQLLSVITIDEKTNMAISPLSLAIVLAMLGSISAPSKQAAFAINHIFDATNLIVFGLGLLNERAMNFKTLAVTQAMLMVPTTERSAVTDIAKKIIEKDFDGHIFLNTSNQTINQWAKQHTNGKITEIIPAIYNINTPGDIVLLSAYFFKDDWSHKFDSDFTVSRPFYIGSSGVIVARQCKMMQMVQNLKYTEDKFHSNPEWQSVILPYKNSTLGAVILLSNKKQSLGELFGSYIDAWSGIWERLNEATKVRVGLSLPKFKFNITGLKLRPILQSLNMSSIFEFGTGVAEGAIFPAEPVCVSDVIQSLFVEVDEAGTTAAAATAAVISKGAVARKPSYSESEYTMNCDHPFIFSIVNLFDGMIHFTSVINNPLL